MTTKTIKTVLFAVLFTVLLIPFSGINGAQAISEKNTTLNEDQCFESITNDMNKQTEKIDRNLLKSKSLENTNFQKLVENKNYDFKNIVDYWIVDPETCTVSLNYVEVRYNVNTGTENHKEAVVTIDGNSKNVLKAELHDPLIVRHTNYTTTLINWAGISQMDGTTESSSDMTEAQAYYDVPTPNDPSGFNCGTGAYGCYLSVWSGLTEDQVGADTMVQGGTDSVCLGTDCATGRDYYAWLEKVDNDGSSSATQCTITVGAGDSIRATTGYFDSTNKYSVNVYNISEFEICSTSYTSETEDSHYAQFMVERPYQGAPYNFYTKLPSFADFDIRGEYDISGVTHGLGDYSSDGHTWKTEMKNGATTNIGISWPNTSTDKITVDYQSSSGTS